MRCVGFRAAHHVTGEADCSLNLALVSHGAIAARRRIGHGWSEVQDSYLRSR